jgi:hypothetical protein
MSFSHVLSLAGNLNLVSAPPVSNPGGPHQNARKTPLHRKGLYAPATDAVSLTARFCGSPRTLDALAKNVLFTERVVHR